MTQPRQRPVRTPPRLSLIGGFSLTVNGSPVTLRTHAQRVLAYLALQPAGQAQPRADLADRLWGEVPAERSQASLRTALWRIRQADSRLVRATREAVRLHEAVEVDVRRCVAQASRLIAGDEDLEPHDMDLSAFRGDLLPGWDEDWLLLERERVRQVQIRALEALAHRLRRLGRHVEAIDAAFAAIAEEPLRESAHAALIDVYLAERDVAQARHQLERYAALLWSELAIKPSDELTNRVAAAAG